MLDISLYMWYDQLILSPIVFWKEEWSFVKIIITIIKQTKKDGVNSLFLLLPDDVEIL